MPNPANKLKSLTTSQLKELHEHIKLASISHDAGGDHRAVLRKLSKGYQGDRKAIYRALERADNFEDVAEAFIAWSPETESGRGKWAEQQKDQKWKCGA